MTRTGEKIGAICFISATTIGSLALGEIKLNNTRDQITENNSRINECMDTLTEACVTEAGVTLELDYSDLLFENGTASVNPGYFYARLDEAKLQEPDPLDVRMVGGTYGILAGAMMWFGAKGAKNIYELIRQRRSQSSEKKKPLLDVAETTSTVSA